MKKLATLPLALLLGGSLACGAESDTAPVADPCSDWNTAAFFDWATVADVRTCLDAGESVNAMAPDGRTPMHFAAPRDDPAIIGALISAGARLGVKAEGLTPLCLAARDGRSAPVVRALLEEEPRLMAFAISCPAAGVSPVPGLHSASR